MKKEDIISEKKKEIHLSQEQLKNLSESYESEMERSYTQHENELMGCEYMDKQYKSDMKILSGIIAILLAFIVFLIIN